MTRVYEVLSSAAASTIRQWKGLMAAKEGKQPEKLLTFYDREGCHKSRMVREILTELDLDALIFPCPAGGTRFIEPLHEAFNTRLANLSRPPALIDENTGTALLGPDEIVSYLMATYANKRPGPKKTDTVLGNVQSRLATALRLGRGVNVAESRKPIFPLELYSFESSPFSRLVRERLCELELPYILKNLGKQQLADMGTPGFRLTLKPYSPLPGTKRERFYQQHGTVQVPYLVDINEDVSLFDSVDIIRYLDNTYAL